MALILNIETSTNTCSVALANNGELLGLKESTEDKSHASQLTIFIEEIFNKSKINIKDLDAVSISKGPGSYTGLRIGVSTAKGIAYGLGIKLISVNTLKSMSYGTSSINSINSNLYCPMIDARRMEVYTAIFNANNETIIETKAEIIDNNSFLDLLENNKILFFGNGANKCKDYISNKNAIYIDNFKMSSKHMIKLSEHKYNKNIFDDVAYFEPFYLKDFVATIPKKNIFKH